MMIEFVDDGSDLSTVTGLPLEHPSGEPAFEGRRYTGFCDRYGTPIIEGDLVITRERSAWFRRASIWLQDRGLLRSWWGRLGRRKGRVWLGVVVEMDDGVNPRQWIFQSANMAVTIHSYWQSDLQIVDLPRGCTYTWRYLHWREWEQWKSMYPTPT